MRDTFIFKAKPKAKKSKETIAVDFDGVIHDYKHPIEGKRMGPPIQGAKEALTKLQEKYEIVIFTIWKPESHGIIEEFMKYYKLPFDRITNIKPQAVAYIDDKAIRFATWQEVLKQV